MINLFFFAAFTIWCGYTVQAKRYDLAAMAGLMAHLFALMFVKSLHL